MRRFLWAGSCWTKGWVACPAEDVARVEDAGHIHAWGGVAGNRFHGPCIRL